MFSDEQRKRQNSHWLLALVDLDESSSPPRASPPINDDFAPFLGGLYGNLSPVRSCADTNGGY